MAGKGLECRGPVRGIALSLLWLAGTARGIVVSDEPNLHVVIPPSDYDGVGCMIYRGQPGGSTGVLIHPWYVLTAKHILGVGAVSDHTFRLDLADGTPLFNVVERFLHPTADLAVGRLDRSAKLSGYALYTASQELNKTGIMVGYGVSGTGLTGPDPNYPRGTKRYGFNRIDQIQTDSNGIQYLLTDFDGPNAPGPLDGGTLGIDKEVMFAAGDSGGPLFVKIGDTFYVAGINTGLGDQNGNNIMPDYTDVGWSVRVRTCASWISGQIAEMMSLTVTIVNDLWGDVVLDPEPTDPNAPEYPAGIRVTLRAVPVPDKAFKYWTLYDPNHPDDANYAVLDANTVTTVLMDTDREVEAAFSCGSSTMPLLTLFLPLAAAVRIRRRW
mgnify:CR=1 FL=1